MIDGNVYDYRNRLLKIKKDINNTLDDISTNYRKISDNWEDDNSLVFCEKINNSKNKLLEVDKVIDTLLTVYDGYILKYEKYKS